MLRNLSEPIQYDPTEKKDPVYSMTLREMILRGRRLFENSKAKDHPPVSLDQREVAHRNIKAPTLLCAPKVLPLLFRVQTPFPPLVFPPSPSCVQEVFFNDQVSQSECSCQWVVQAPMHQS